MIVASMSQLAPGANQSKEVLTVTLYKINHGIAQINI
jgi:hypothetical protein